MPTPDAAVETREESISQLRQHVAIPNAFETWTILDVRADTAGFELIERQLDQPFRKDYDAVEDPLHWPVRFDVSNWALIGAFDATGRVGGAICAFNTPGVDLLEGRSDLVVLWDLRVRPSAQSRGVGATIFRSVEAWARERNCCELKVETQNTNVAACRFYARQGCLLGAVNFGAYPELPGEVQLIWRKDLETQRPVEPTEYPCVTFREIVGGDQRTHWTSA